MSRLQWSRSARVVSASAVMLLAACGGASSASAQLAPALPVRGGAEWINSAPLTLAGLRGKVVLIDFWTFECWNCYRSFPWLNAVEARYRDQGLVAIGIHTPEFEREKVISSIRDKVREFKISYPVMVDNDHAAWNAFENRYWPAFYLIDRQGQIQAIYAGETHVGDQQAKRIEAQIESLLAQP